MNCFVVNRRPKERPELTYVLKNDNNCVNVSFLRMSRHWTVVRKTRSVIFSLVMLYRSY